MQDQLAAFQRLLKLGGELLAPAGLALLGRGPPSPPAGAPVEERRASSPTHAIASTARDRADIPRCRDISHVHPSDRSSPCSIPRLDDWVEDEGAARPCSARFRPGLARAYPKLGMETVPSKGLPLRGRSHQGHGMGPGKGPITPDSRVADRVAARSATRSAESGLNAIVVEDHVVMRKGIEFLLRRAGWSVIGFAGDAANAFDLILRRKPHVVLIDLGLPGESGAKLVERLLVRDPNLNVLLYTGVDDQQALLSALECGAHGFALKAGAPEELVMAVEIVANGGSYLDPRLRRMLHERAAAKRAYVLTEREREILHLLAGGMTGEQIATSLYISIETVRTHVRNAMKRLDARTRVQAIAIALQDGEITV